MPWRWSLTLIIVSRPPSVACISCISWYGNKSATTTVLCGHASSASMTLSRALVYPVFGGHGTTRLSRVLEAHVRVLNASRLGQRAKQSAGASQSPPSRQNDQRCGNPPTTHLNPHRRTLDNLPRTQGEHYQNRYKRGYVATILEALKTLLVILANHRYTYLKMSYKTPLIIN